MGALDALKDGLSTGVGEVTEFISAHPVETAIGAGVVTVGGALAVAAIVGKASKTKARRASTKRGRKRDARFKSKQKHERRYKRKRKYKVYGKKGWINPKKKHSKSKRGIHYTKKGQPYKILASGKARFIKKTKRRTR